MFFRTRKHNWLFEQGFYYIFFSSERNTLYLTFKYKISVVFLYIYCYYKRTAKNIDDSMLYLC